MTRLQKNTLENKKGCKRYICAPHHCDDFDFLMKHEKNLISLHFMKKHTPIS